MHNNIHISLIHLSSTPRAQCETSLGKLIIYTFSKSASRAGSVAARKRWSWGLIPAPVFITWAEKEDKMPVGTQAHSYSQH